MRYLVLCLSLLSMNVAAKEMLPAGCNPVLVQDNSLTLTAKANELFMLHNLSDIDLWLTHPISDPSASAGFSSRLQGDHWSALAIDVESFEISCIESKPGHEQQVSCANVLAVCKLSDVSIPKKLSGTFWAGENMSLSELTAYVGRRGFVIPNSSQ